MSFTIEVEYTEPYDYDTYVKFETYSALPILDINQNLNLRLYSVPDSYKQSDVGTVNIYKKSDNSLVRTHTFGSSLKFSNLADDGSTYQPLLLGNPTPTPPPATTVLKFNFLISPPQNARLSLIFPGWEYASPPVYSAIVNKNSTTPQEMSAPIVYKNDDINYFEIYNHNTNQTRRYKPEAGDNTFYELNQQYSGPNYWEIDYNSNIYKQTGRDPNTYSNTANSGADGAPSLPPQNSTGNGTGNGGGKLTPGNTALPICFYGHAKVHTDQGHIAIKDIKIGTHSINYIPIKFITKCYNSDKLMAKFYKNALGPNSPNTDTEVSLKHKILYRTKWVEASDLVKSINDTNKAELIAYTGEPIYNLALGQFSSMRVNGMTCETLHPKMTSIKSAIYTDAYGDNHTPSTAYIAEKQFSLFKF